VTLGRNRSEGPADALLRALSRQQGWKGGEQSVREIHVMASNLAAPVKPEETLSHGPKYTVLSRAKLQ
jgi:hypothetical protein